MATIPPRVAPAAARAFRTALAAKLAEKRLRVDDLVQRTGCARANIYRILRGQTTPSLVVAQRLALAVGIRLEAYSLAGGTVRRGPRGVLTLLKTAVREGYSADFMATTTGLDRSFVFRVLAGDNSPTIQHAQQLLRSAGCDLRVVV